MTDIKGQAWPGLLLRLGAICGLIRALMEVVRTHTDVREQVAQARRSGRSVGLVPTMGVLHAGHRSLIQRARERCDFVAVSIFVNPTQFGPGEDYQDYPRSLETDLDVCQQAGVDLVFIPGVAEIYVENKATTIHVAGLTEGLCGPYRPGHFDGVCTVVAKLFDIVGPDQAFFGEKDYQQLQVIKKMVADLDVPVKIESCPTVRDPDGLAMSSRNTSLTDAQRRQAAGLHQVMCRAATKVSEGVTDVALLIRRMEAGIAAAGPCRIDYVKIVHPDTLVEMARVDRPARICLAVHIGSVRLIDNLAVDGGGCPR